MRAVVWTCDALLRDGLKCLLSDQAWCVAVTVAATFEELNELIRNGAAQAVVVSIDEMAIGDLASLETAKKEHGLKVVAIASGDRLSPPMDRVADRVANRSGGFEALRAALRGLDVPNGAPAGAVRESLAVYGISRRLTQREREVARLVSQGLPNRQIAKVLGIQEQSVKNLLSVVMRKMNCDNRVQVALHLSAPSH